MIEFIRQNNRHVESWQILYHGQSVGYIVRSLGDFLVVRRKKDPKGDDALEVAIRGRSYRDATHFVTTSIHNRYPEKSSRIVL